MSLEAEEAQAKIEELRD
jgi:hypothetical protein